MITMKRIIFISIILAIIAVGGFLIWSSQQIPKNQMYTFTEEFIRHQESLKSDFPKLTFLQERQIKEDIEILRTDESIGYEAPSNDAITRLVKIGPAAIPLLMGALYDAILVTSDNVTKETIQDRDSRFFITHILYVIKKIGDPSASKPLVDFLPKLEGSNLAHLIETIGACGKEDSVAIIVPYLESSNDFVRHATIHTLSEIGTEDALTALTYTISYDSDMSNRVSALRGMVGSKEKITNNKLVHQSVCIALTQTDCSVLDYAIIAAKELQVQNATPYLIDIALNDDLGCKMRIRGDAVSAFAYLSDAETAIPQLILMLNHSIGEVRTSSAIALSARLKPYLSKDELFDSGFKLNTFPWKDNQTELDEGQTQVQKWWDGKGQYLFNPQ